MKKSTTNALNLLTQYASRGVAHHKATAAAADQPASVEALQEEKERLVQELELALALSTYKDLLIAAALWGQVTVENGKAAMYQHIEKLLMENPRNAAAFQSEFRASLTDAEAYLFAEAYQDFCTRNPAFTLPAAFGNDLNNMLYVDAIVLVNANLDALDDDGADDADRI